jgi:hypothetical protein
MSSSPTATGVQADSAIIVGSHKRCPTQRVIENGDPLAHKRAKNKHQTTTIEDDGEPVAPPHPEPDRSSCILEAANGSDDDDDFDQPDQVVTVVEEVEDDDESDSVHSEKDSIVAKEDDHTELCECCISLLGRALNLKPLSSSPQGLRCTNLHFF